MASSTVDHKNIVTSDAASEITLVDPKAGAATSKKSAMGA
jgi:hypothetical protein